MKISTQTTRSQHRGFTLLEVLLVLAILIAIAAMVVPNIIGRGEEASKKITAINIANFEKAAQMYKIDNKVWPDGSTEEVVDLLRQVEDAQGQARASYLEKIPMDAWDMPLQYQYPPPEQTGNTFKPLIWSAGPDRQEGTDDDITNIDELIKQQDGF